jgi:hypothetical protein
VAELFPPKYRMFRVENPIAASLLEVRFPSIVFFQTADRMMEVYDSEPVLASMLAWLESISASKFKKFELTDLVAPDGLPVKLVMSFLRKSEKFAPLRALTKEATRFPQLLWTWTDPGHYRKFLSHLNYSSKAKRLCLLSSFVSIGYTECQTLAAFAGNTALLKSFPTPRDFYGYAVEVTELGFRELLRHGPVFVVFDLKRCDTCHQRVDAARQSAQRMAEYGSKTNWCIWDGERSPPRFASDLSIPMPSLWYFPSDNIAEAVFYRGHANVVGIVRWAHTQTRDFDLPALLQRESELAQE